MTFYSQVSSCKLCNQYPYIGKISIEENFDLIHQFVKKRHIAENHINPSIIHTARDLTGPPTVFPNYHFIMGRFDLDYLDVSISPWQNEPSYKLTNFLPWNYNTRMKEINNYIILEFHEAVYPIRVSIYEVNNPGHVIKIWAYKSDNEWFLLWDGPYRNILHEFPGISSRLFTPLLQSCNFKTKMLKLEFFPNTWVNCTKLDAVMLIGTSKLIFFKNPKENPTDFLKKINYVCFREYHKCDADNLTPVFKNVHLDMLCLLENILKHCIISERDREKTFYKNNLEHKKVPQEVKPIYVHHLLLKKYAKQIRLCLDESKERSFCILLTLPDEMILTILKYLDMKSLSRLNQVNKYLYKLTLDPLLYKHLNVRNIWRINSKAIIRKIFDYFIPRCRYLKQLDLTSIKFSLQDFKIFLHNCGEHLTHLRINECPTIDNLTICTISEICKNLKDLDLSRCHQISEGLSHLVNLERLERLKLTNISINTQVLCNILRRNSRIRELELNFVIVNLDDVAIELRNSCQNLEVINLELSRYITLRGIDALANCKNLRKVKLHFKISPQNIEIASNSFCQLLSSCQLLEEVHMSHIILNDHNLNLLIQCEHLEQLYLYNVNPVTPDKYSIIFEQCLKLKRLYFTFCKINDDLVNQWKEKYPHVIVFNFD